MWPVVHVLQMLNSSYINFILIIKAVQAFSIILKKCVLQPHPTQTSSTGLIFFFLLKQ